MVKTSPKKIKRAKAIRKKSKRRNLMKVTNPMTNSNSQDPTNFLSSKSRIY